MGGPGLAWRARREVESGVDGRLDLGHGVELRARGVDELLRLGNRPYSRAKRRKQQLLEGGVSRGARCGGDERPGIGEGYVVDDTGCETLRDAPFCRWRRATCISRYSTGSADLEEDTAVKQDSRRQLAADMRREAQKASGELKTASQTAPLESE